ncbi:MAG: FtsH protease activity modulator HflK [Sphaerochaeta sp.]|jgi:membrane protease subunit HflK|nr:FtsH protease activity modulator HflK [Sphaerochaeta sp.]MDX9914949.1 FtsH protease activity modulator HflK [Sphaerochaeta sp.]
MDTMQQSPRPARRTVNLSPKLVLWVVAAVVLVMLVLSSFFVVDQTEQAVVLRLGKYNRTVGPGLQTKIPLGIEASYNVPTQVVQTMTFGYRTNSGGSPLFQHADYTNESLMLTGDLNIIDVQWIVQYKIENAYNWLFNVESRETTIRDISQSVMNKLVGDLPILSVMTSQRTRIEVEAQENMQTLFDTFGLGVRVITVKLQNIVPPVGEVQDAFEDVNKAIQDMNRLINEGKQNYNKVIPSARGEANQIIQVAEGYASERVNQAQGDVARFDSVRQEYEKSKEITRRRLYIETMESIITPQEGGSVTLVDKKLANFLPIQMLEGGAK